MDFRDTASTIGELLADNEQLECVGDKGPE